MNSIRLYLFFLLPAFGLSVCAGQTTALYEPTSLAVGPFPSNVTTVTDPAQSTGLRVNLPSSSNVCDPSSSPSVCSNSALLNQLDGFSVNPRLMVCFSAAADPATLHDGISIISVGNGSLVGVNQIVFDPTSNCAFAKPDQVLNQQSAYLLTVTDSVHDAAGNKVQEDGGFDNCLKSSDAYCQALSDALNKVVQPGSANRVIAASLFTTMSATAWLEKTRSFVDLTEPPIVLPAGIPSSFKLSNLRAITWVPARSGLPPQNIPLTALSGVDTIAFGLYLSPNFINPSDGTIAVTPTNAPISGALPLPGIPTGIVPVSFHVFLPRGPAPAGGFPVVIYGHGLGDNQFGAPTFIACTLAKKGFATLAIEITGHGYGAGSFVKLTDSLGIPHTVLTPGRGIVIPGKTQIGPTDGCIALPAAVAVRDCGRQTAVDLFALVAAIRKTAGLGMQVNPNRLYYVGQSFGGTYGTLFQAVEPDVKTAVLNGAGGTSVNVARLGITGRALSIGYLASVNPALLNVPPAPPERYFHDAFNDNYSFRAAAPVVNNVPGAMAIQAAFEAADWLGVLGDPLSYAPHLKQSPLAGVPAKSTLFQFGLADLEVPNPTESAVIRAAGAQSSAWFLRFDRAADIAPDLKGVGLKEVGFPILPHRVLSNPTIFNYPNETPLALAEQQQVAAYLASDGTTNPDPNLFLNDTPFATQSIFEIPAVLPEQLNYFQLQP